MNGLPAGQTVHGFGQDGSGELYAMATDTPPNGNGGVVYKLFSVRLTARFSGNLVDLSWPAAGARLQAQVNPPGVGLTKNWLDVPGSTVTNRVVIPINQANGTAFFRLAFQ